MGPEQGFASLVKVAMRFVLAAVTALAASTLTAIEVSLITPRTDRPAAVALAALVLLGVGQAAFAAIHEFRLDKSLVFRTGTQDALSQAYRDLLKQKGLKAENVSISAWMVQRRIVAPWRLRLVRVGRQRLMSHPAPSNITWTKGKGVIGRCWELQNLVLEETEAKWEPYQTCRKDEWKTLPRKVTLRLKHREFVRIRGKYAAVTAVPIARPTDGAFLGCITVDVRSGTSPERVHTQEVVDIAASAGAIIANLVAVVSRWVYTAET